MALQFQNQVPDLLKRKVAELRICCPKEHFINYNFETWERCFTSDKDLTEIKRRFGQSLSRGNVCALGIEAKTEPLSVRRFAMAVMMWGYGTVRYGANRTSKMLAHSQATERLIRGAGLVQIGELVEACLFFRGLGALSQFSWSFFTKYFYFVGLASGLDPMPLILDGNNRENGVAGGMKQLADAGNQGAARAMQLWWSSVDQRSAEGYALYVELVNGWAHDLGCRPDAIEMILWKGFNR
jgi:hypothetical protein